MTFLALLKSRFQPAIAALVPEAARQRERRTASLYDMSRDFAVRTRVDELAAVAAAHLHNLLDTDAIVLLAQSGQPLHQVAGLGASASLSEPDLAVARWVHENRRPAGFGTDTLPATRFSFFPLLGGSRMLVNYGLDRVRFPAPVPVGSRLRGVGRLASATEVPGGYQLVLDITVEIEGASKPACVAAFVVRVLS